MNIDTLNNLSLGEEAIIIKNNIKTKNKKHLNNIGLSNNEIIKCLYKSPLNDPVAYQIQNVIIAIRQEDSKNILIKRINNGIN